MVEEIKVDLRAMSFRLITLMTHYRHPLNFSEEKMSEAKTILERWLKAIELCKDGPPLELLVPLTQDVNTAGMMAVLHKFRKNGEGKKLFASMRFLGFFGETCLPDEIKTIPEEQNIEHFPGFVRYIL